MDHLPTSKNVTWNITVQEYQGTGLGHHFLCSLCMYKACNECHNWVQLLCYDWPYSFNSLVLSLFIFSLFSQKELKYRHEVVSVEQINKKIGIQWEILILSIIEQVVQLWEFCIQVLQFVNEFLFCSSMTENLLSEWLICWLECASKVKWLMVEKTSKWKFLRQEQISFGIFPDNN